MGLFGSFDIESAARLRRIEKKLDLILDSLGLKIEETPMNDILELALNGRKIEAIKRYREVHGVGLKEAKDAVEAMVEDRRVA